MILGILSDTHGHARRTAAAVRLLQQLGAEAFVHCGDVGSPDVLDELAGRRAGVSNRVSQDMPWILVWISARASARRSMCAAFP